MAKKDNEAKAQAKSSGTQIINNGPVDENNGAEVFRFIRSGNRKPIDIVKGQILTVGEDLEQDEVDQLRRSTTWNFDEVKDNG
jgi:hypothetical protein